MWMVDGLACVFNANCMKYYIGCSGFSYKEWKPEFYPEKLPQKQWFEFYTSQFNTLELNVTFYRFPKLSVLQGWYERSPDDFLFAVKAPRLITHYKKFNDSESLLRDFYGSIGDGLKSKLGPVLFQLPKELIYTEERLEKLIQSMDKKFINAIEFRDPSWWLNSVREVLIKNKIIFCGINHPTLPDNFIKGPDVYYRYHGVPKLYYSEYSLSVMKSMAEELRSPAVKHAYIYFNNTANGSAIHNARQLQYLLQ
jgi:uncharacterized protein YecE (DUF72 family)